MPRRRQISHWPDIRPSNLNCSTVCLTFIWAASRALVFEIQSKLSDHFRRIGIEVSSIPGGIEADSEDDELMANTRVFVLTPEKLDGLLRRNQDLTKTVRVVVIDEMQKLEAESEYKPFNVEEEIEQFFGNVENPEDPCGINKITINNNVVTIEAEDMGKDNDYNPGF